MAAAAAIAAAVPVAAAATNGPLLVQGWTKGGGCGPLPRLVDTRAFSADSDYCDYDGQLYLVGPSGRSATAIDPRGTIAPGGHEWAIVNFEQDFSHPFPTIDLFRGTSRRKLDSILFPSGYRLDGALAWSPDGRRLAAGATDPQGHKRLLVLDLRTRVYRTIARGDCPPVAWSVRGLIACERSADYSEVAVVRADGRGRIRPLVKRPRRTSDEGVSWSPDGRWAAFCRSGRGTSIEVVAADGRDLHPVATHLNQSTPVYWSPDGRYLAFLRSATVVVIRPQGGHARPLVANALRLGGWLSA